MTILGRPYRTGGGSSGYTITHSCMFDGAGYLHWTPGGGGDSRRLYSISFWFKIDDPDLTTSIYPFSAGTGGNNQESLSFRASTNKLRYRGDTGGITWTEFLTTRVFRDPTAWAHFALIRNGNSVTQYVNGVAVSAFDTLTAPTSDDGFFGHANSHKIGAEITPGQYFTGYLAEFEFVDGAAWTISDFGAFDDHGVWRPVSPNGLSFGTNGFRLDFADPANLGNDVSGNGNHFTAVGLGTDHQTTDSPSHDVIAGIGNHALFNPLYPESLSGTNITLSEGRRKMAMSTVTQNRGLPLSIPVPESGKWYAAIKLGKNSNPGGTGDNGTLQIADPGVGLISNTNNLAGAWGIHYGGFRFINTNGSTDTSAASGLGVAGDVVQIAVDVDNDKVWVGTNNSWFSDAETGDGDPVAGTNPTFTGIDPGGKQIIAQIYYSMWVSLQTPDQNDYAPPSGFSWLSTEALPAPVVADPSRHFQVELIGHNGTNTNFTLNWDADAYDTLFVVKNRDGAEKWYCLDGLNGYDRYTELPSDHTVGQTTDANVLSVSGATVTLGSTLSNANYVLYAWKLGPSAGRITNNAGSIQTTVSVNTTSGVSALTYTGTGVNATIGHSLGVAPAMLQAKGLDGSSGMGWQGYHRQAGATKGWSWATNENSPTNSTYWQDLPPTPSVISIGTGSSMNANGIAYVIYAFAPVPGFSFFGGYTGNQNSDGVYAPSGDVSPIMMLVKGISLSSPRGPHLYDSVRSPANPLGVVLQPHVTDAEAASDNNTLVATGFKSYDASIMPNDNGGTFATCIWGRPLGGAGTPQARAR